MAGAKEVAKAEEQSRKLRKSHLQWVPLGKMTVSIESQGVYRPGHATAIAANLQLEAIGFPVVSKRKDGLYYILDGQHRIAALRIFGFAETDQFQVECYEDLTEAEEAELFLERNTIKPKSAWDKYHVALTAGRPEELAIDHVVRWAGFTVASYNRNRGNTVTAIGTLREIYRRMGPTGLGRTLRITRESYGEVGATALVLDGMSLLLHRYGKQIVDEELTARLQKEPGGLNGIMIPANKLRATLGQPLPHCVAASMASIYNKGRGVTTRLAPWWREG